MKKHASQKTILTLNYVAVLAALIVLVGGYFYLLQRNLIGQLPGLVQAKTKVVRSMPKRKSKRACSVPGGNKVHCTATVSTDGSDRPLTGTLATIGGYGPVEYHLAYNLPCTPGGPVQAICSQPSSFAGAPIIGIVDAYGMPTIENDLNAYSKAFGIPSCTKANGCLTVVNQNGGTALPIGSDVTWGMETAMDVEVAHTVCQTCRILLVQANDNSWNNLFAAEATAARMGAVSISNSWGAGEWSGETAFDQYFNFPGIAVTASSGDWGYGTLYPAASKYVISVGGTTLNVYTDGTYAGETAWPGAGSGCSKYQPASAMQMKVANWPLTKCGVYKGLTDISADADPNTGASVYDSQYSTTSPWLQVGGTSLSSPIIASAFALARTKTTAQIADILYANASANTVHDVTGGANGTCANPLMCTSMAGYDGPTGLGTPFGIGIFALPTGYPTPTNTPKPTSTPTPTPSPTPKPTLTPTPKPTATPTPTPTSPPKPTPQPPDDTDKPQHKKVMILDFNPVLPGKGVRLRDYLTNTLHHVNVGLETAETAYINKMPDITHGYLNYTIVEKHDNIDDFIPFSSGFKFSGTTYEKDFDRYYLKSYGSQCWFQSNQLEQCAPPDLDKLFATYQVCDKVNAGLIDEIWIWHGPVMFVETDEAASKYRISQHLLSYVSSKNGCKKPVVVKHYNYSYQVETDSMWHLSLNLITQQFMTDFGDPPVFNQFTAKYTKNQPAGCGFNGSGLYQSMTDPKTYPSTCEDWPNYPQLTGKVTNIGCSAWGCSTNGFLEWWFKHVPANPGKYNGIWNNWWKYVAGY